MRNSDKTTLHTRVRNPIWKKDEHLITQVFYVMLPEIFEHTWSCIELTCDRHFLVYNRLEVGNMYEMTVKELSKRIKNGTLRVPEVVEYFQRRIQHLNPKFNAFVSVTNPVVDDQADGVLPIPYALKDNILALGTRTTCGSKILEDYESPYDATVNKQLKRAGAILLGKTNLDEFAMGSTTEFSVFGPTKNPWDPSKVPGGSSGGSAVAVATGMAPFALGSDTGGSVRLPAAFCGVVGYKPTYGLVSRYGLVAFGSSLDQIGPITKSVEDAAIVASIISGYDPLDSTSVPRKVNLLEQFGKSVDGLKVAVPREALETDGLDKDVRNSFEDTLKLLKKLDCEIHYVDLPILKYGIAAYYIIAPGEASSNLARYDGMRYGLRAEGKDLDQTYKMSRGEGFGEEVKRRILIGTFTLSATYYEAYYDKALRVRRLFADALAKIFQEYQILTMPVAPVKPYAIGEVKSPLVYYLMDVYTIPANLAGLPAVAVPVDLKDGLPVGVQFLAKRFDDPTLLNLAHAFEAARGEFPSPKIALE
mgnify:CR=1 FL=1